MASKEWELTVTQYAKCRNSFTELTIQKNTAHEAQKKMLEYQDGFCTNHSKRNKPNSVQRFKCPECRAELKAEFGIGEV